MQGLQTIFFWQFFWAAILNMANHFARQIVRPALGQKATLNKLLYALKNIVYPFLFFPVKPRTLFWAIIKIHYYANSFIMMM